MLIYNILVIYIYIYIYNESIDFLAELSKSKFKSASSLCKIETLIWKKE